MAWWGWVTLGIGLLALEILTPAGFFLVFFGLGALVTGIFVGLGVLNIVWLQWVVFSVVSVLGLVLLRRKAMKNMPTSGTSVDSMIGETATAIEEIAANGGGKIELRGSSWGARNSSSQTIEKGGRCIVEKVEGLTITVRHE